MWRLLPAAASAGLVMLCLLLDAGRSQAADFVSEPVAQAVQLVEPSQVHASGLTLNETLSQTASFDSNPLLLTAGAKPLYGSVTSADTVISSATPALQLNADTLLNANAFNQTDFNSIDVHSKAGVTQQGERWAASLVEKTDYDTTRTSELSGFDLSTRPFRHLGFEADPELSFKPSEIDKVTFDGSYTTSQYQNTVFSDFDVFSLTPSYVHNFDPRNAGILTVQAQRYETTDNQRSTTDTIGPSLGWISALTPEVAAKMTFGAQTSKQTQAGSPSTPWDLQYIFSGDLTFRNQRHAVELVASRAEYPYGNGSEALLTSVTANDIYQFTPVLSLNFGAGYQSSTYQSTQAGDLQTAVFVNLGSTYTVNNKLDLTAAYQFRYETLADVQSRAEEHVLTLSLAYRLDPQPL